MYYCSLWDSLAQWRVPRHRAQWPLRNTVPCAGELLMPPLRNTALTALCVSYAVEPNVQHSQIHARTTQIQALYGPLHVKGITVFIPTSLGALRHYCWTQRGCPVGELYHCGSLQQNVGTAHSMWKESLKPRWLADQTLYLSYCCQHPVQGERDRETDPSLEKIKAWANAHPQPLIQSYQLKISR